MLTIEWLAGTGAVPAVLSAYSFCYREWGRKTTVDKMIQAATPKDGVISDESIRAIAALAEAMRVSPLAAPRARRRCQTSARPR